ncbi:glycosyltransferase family 2 protein [Spirosoma sp. RP8]|uniref:Glycosyltransferase family 2 protein n=1 Tax=Spirosoma liriopis TaxID=2937440 RepID=A0ABT0HSY5_9BACT|nr:glycosyltransferase family 2 protein [Spirosoma liriopis]MCK8495291.1 glycosyltransferase family 2 protein [Spirosoma liriopis]
MKTSLVTTLRNADTTLDYFINYHLSIGFDHLFLFFDDPDDKGFIRYEHHPSITAIKHDTVLRNLWLQTRSAIDNYAFADREVMARQVMNVDLALQMAQEAGIDWLLHIDVDELFYSPNQSVWEHFNELSSRGISVARYFNHEANPETDCIQNYFGEVSLFKRNRETLTKYQSNWLLNNLNSLTPYFNFYKNGKSAAITNSSTLPDGVHGFESINESVLLTNGPFILHFPCCGFDHFLAKYRTLGQFSDKWFNCGEVIEHIIPVHSWSRDVVQTNDIARIKAFYDQIFIHKVEHVKDAALQAGVFERIKLPSMSQLLTSQPSKVATLL